MKNIILIGMPGAGKSTVGVILAKTLGMDFIDTDLIIQKRTGKKLIEIINGSGIDGFLKAESDVLSSLKAENSVIATGGSAVYSESGMKNLRSLGKTVYLSLPEHEIEKRINNIKTRGIAMHKNQSLKDLYKEREPLYRKYADVTIDCNGTNAEECITKILSELNI